MRRASGVPSAASAGTPKIRSAPRVPRRDDAVQRGADDAVVGTFDDVGQPCLHLRHAGALGDVLEREQDQVGRLAVANDGTRIELHDPGAGRVEVGLDFVILEGRARGKHLFEQRAQFGNGPAAVGKVVEMTALHVGRRQAEHAIERAACHLDAQLAVQNEQRIAGRGDDGMSIVSRVAQRRLREFRGVNVFERQQRAVYAVVGRAVGEHPKRVPVRVLVLHFVLAHLHGLDDLGQQRFEARRRHRERKMGGGPADVAGQHVQDLGRGRREPAYAQVGAEHDDRHVDAAEQIGHVVVEPEQLGVAHLQLLIDRRQFLVERLQFLLGRFEFLVGALQLLVRREDFFVARLQFLVGRFLLLDHRLQVLARGGQLLTQRLEFVAGQLRGLLGGHRIGHAPAGCGAGSSNEIR